MRPLALAFALLAACGGKEPSPTGGPAGEVLRVEGEVTATRAAQDAQPRVLTRTAEVFADDTVVTGAGATVDIRLAHNGAVWKLGPGETRRVDGSAAWRAAEGGGEVSGFAQTDPDRTASAGRHTDMTAEEGRIGERPTKRGGKGGGPRDTGATGDAFGSGGLGLRGGPTPKLATKMGAPEVDGALDAQVIRRVMRSRYPALKRCYEHELDKDPKFEANVRILFTVGTGGRLSPITVDPEPTPTFTACLKAAMRAVRMPAADAETEVVIPLQFALP